MNATLCCCRCGVRMDTRSTIAFNGRLRFTSPSTLPKSWVISRSVGAPTSLLPPLALNTRMLIVSSSERDT